ncbi:hypothetical protein D9M68_675190 [compost metagenome]
MLQDAVEPLGIDDGHAAAGIGQAVFQLGAGPPRVQRRHDRACEQRAVERHRPLRQVAHRQRHAVALAHAVAHQRVCQRDGRAPEGIVGNALVLVDHEGAVAEGTGRVEQVAQRGGCVLPDGGGDAADHARLGLERRAGPGQPGMGLGQGHDRPVAGRLRIA